MNSSSDGPTMLVATEALRPPKLRIGRLGNNFTLPRTVPAAALISGALCALVAVGLFGAVVGYTVTSVAYSALVGALIGVALVTYSPLRGESLLRWLGLKIKSRRNRARYVDGFPVRLAVGICYIPNPNQGMVSMRSGAVQVRPGLFDERGTRRREARRVLPTWFVEQVRSSNEESSAHPGFTPVALAVGSRMEAFRTAAASSELPEDYSPAAPLTARRFGRWEQDATALRSLYVNQTLPEEGDPQV